MSASLPFAQHLELELNSGCALIARADSLSHMEADLQLKSVHHGGLQSRLLRRLSRRRPEQLLQIYNATESSRHLGLTHPLPGELICRSMTDQELTFAQHAFLACDANVKIRIRWAGIGSWLAGQGLFQLRARGRGRIWLAGFGAILITSLDGERMVDPGHVIAFDGEIRYRQPTLFKLLLGAVRRERGLFEIYGRGKVYLQSRSLQGIADRLNHIREV